MLLLDASKFDFKRQKLHIKPLSERDFKLYQDLYCCERTMRFIGTPLTEAEARVSFLHALAYSQQPKGLRLFMTVQHEDDMVPAGIVSISHLDRDNKTAELGSILNSKYHGRLIGKESVIALMARITQVLNIGHFLLDIQRGNLPALRAARIMGFKPVLNSETLYELK